LRGSLAQVSQQPKSDARITALFDAQTIALLGRDLVIDQLHRAGLEVALPRRDHGIDVIAYVDRERSFQALPIQVKASAGFRWVVNQKYGPFADCRLHPLSDIGRESDARPGLCRCLRSAGCQSLSASMESRAAWIFSVREGLVRIMEPTAAPRPDVTSPSRRQHARLTP